MPVDRIETMEQLVSGSAAQPRFRTVILAAFSMLALVTRADVLRLVVGRAAALIGVGTCVGLAGSVGADFQ
jgi:hypothetical protein